MLLCSINGEYLLWWCGKIEAEHLTFDILLLSCLKTFCKSIHRIFLIIVGRWRLRIRLATKWHWVGFSFLKLLFTARQPVPLLRNHKSSKTPPRSDWLAAAETLSAVTWKSNWLEPPLGIAFLIQSIGARPWLGKIKQSQIKEKPWKITTTLLFFGRYFWACTIIILNFRVWSKKIFDRQYSLPRNTDHEVRGFIFNWNK